MRNRINEKFNKNCQLRNRR